MAGTHRRAAILLLVATTSGTITFVLRSTVFPDAHWWNLMMAGLLLVVLMAYLWQRWSRDR